jgi:hypothetical protein
MNAPDHDLPRHSRDPIHGPSPDGASAPIPPGAALPGLAFNNLLGRVSIAAKATSRAARRALTWILDSAAHRSELGRAFTLGRHVVHPKGDEPAQDGAGYD